MPASRRALLIAAGSLVAVAVVGLGASTALAGDEVPAGTSVQAVDLGGLDRAAAEAKVATLTFPEPVQLSAAGELLTVDPAKAGLRPDARATVDEALSVGPLDRLRALVGARRELELRTAVDARGLAAELARVKQAVDRAPREGAVRFTREAVPVATLPLTGRSLDVDGAAEAVRAQWPSAGPVEVPVDVAEVATTAEQVQQLLQDVAIPAVAAPVEVSAPGGSVTVTPLDIASSLRLETVDGELAPRVDAAVLHERIRPQLRKVGRPPVDATFETASGRPVLVPSRGGTSISADDLAGAVLPVLADPPPRTASAPLSPAQPRVTTERARTLGVVEELGSFTSRHPCCRPRVENIHRIADIVDGYVVLPGEQFDLNAVVGPRDKARGFVEAPQILEGEFVDRVGGGVSQFATALFNAVFFSGLEDVTHSPHSYYISRYPPGREATVSFPLPDLIFKNDSPHGVLVDTSYTGTSITVTFWGTERFDEVRSVTGPRTRLRPFDTQYVQRDDCTATDGEMGFDIVVTRVFVQDGDVVRREPFKTRYKPEPRFICGPPPTRAGT